MDPGGARAEKRPQADDCPDAFENDEAELEGMEGDPAEDDGASSVEDVVSGAAGVDPTQLVATIGDEDEERPEEGDELASEVHFVLFNYVLCLDPNALV